jgi:hypothetical protein
VLAVLLLVQVASVLALALELVQQLGALGLALLAVSVVLQQWWQRALVMASALELVRQLGALVWAALQPAHLLVLPACRALQAGGMLLLPAQQDMQHLLPGRWPRPAGQLCQGRLLPAMGLQHWGVQQRLDPLLVVPDPQQPALLHLPSLLRLLLLLLLLLLSPPRVVHQQASSLPAGRCLLAGPASCSPPPPAPPGCPGPPPAAGSGPGTAAPS